MLILELKKALSLEFENLDFICDVGSIVIALVVGPLLFPTIGNAASDQAIYGDRLGSFWIRGTAGILIYVSLAGMIGSLLSYITYLFNRSPTLLKSYKLIGAVSSLFFLIGFTTLLTYSGAMVRIGNIELYDGSRAEAKAVNLDGWEILTTDEGKFITFSKNGSSILYITEDGFADVSGLGRTINIESETRERRIELYDEDMDTNYELMELYTKEKTFSDKDLNGVIDMVIEWDTLEMEVNYKGVLYPVVKSGENRFITVEGQQIDLRKSGLIWEPVKQANNEERD